MDISGHIIICSLLLFVGVFTQQVNSLDYNVHWLGGPTTIERDGVAKQKVDIYCYSGTPKSILSLWQTVKFHIKVKNDEFRQYIGKNPEEVFKEYTEDSYGWSVVNPFHNKNQKTMSVNLFSSTCMAINTKQQHSFELQVIRIDLWRVLLMLFGIVLIYSSATLSSNPVFFYICGMLIGVFASFMVVVYYISKLLPAKRTLTYGVLIGGWTVGVYVLQQVWDNIRSIVLAHQAYTFWYTLIVAFTSFLVCYRIGPPRNERSKNLVMWSLQAIGVSLIFFSSEYQEASAAVIVSSLVAKYFPESLLRRLQGYWRRRFPPSTRLLSSEEYYEQGARETKVALDSLRRHCASPDCAQWAIMLKLNDSRRFASFVEGNSHLSDEEILDYESYAFSLDRKDKPRHTANSTGNHLEISDDDSSDEDEEEL